MGVFHGVHIQHTDNNSKTFYFISFMYVFKFKNMHFKNMKWPGVQVEEYDQGNILKSGRKSFTEI